MPTGKDVTKIRLRLSKVEDIDLFLVFSRMTGYGVRREAAEAVCEAFRDHITKGTYKEYVPRLCKKDETHNQNSFVFSISTDLYRQIEAQNIPATVWLKILFRRYMRIPVELCVGLPVCDESCRNAMLKDQTGQNVSFISAARENSLPKPVISTEPEKPQKEVKEQNTRSEMSKIEEMDARMEAMFKNNEPVIENIEDIMRRNNLAKNEKVEENQKEEEEEPNMDFLLAGL